MKDLLAGLKKLNYEFYVDKSIIESLELDGKMMEFIEFLIILFLEMRSLLVLLNP